MVTAIVGASQAGQQVAASLREQGYAEPIFLIGDEPHAPYQRPPLSKGFIKGSVTADMLWFRDPAYYAQHDITLITGESVVSVDRQARSLRTRAGRELNFSHLVMATGARARALALDGADLPGVLGLRTLDDARHLSDRLNGCERLVVIGGGFIGLEVAAMAAELGKRVTVLEAADRLMGRSLGAPVSEFVAAAHRRRGLDIRLGARIQRIVGDRDGVQAIELADGERMAAPLVVVGVGSVVPDALPMQLGLAFDRGIVVDAHARTSIDHILAAGDCTVRSLGADGMVRLESVHNAIEQGKTAAASILGKPPPPAAVPWFWSDQGALRLQMAGLSRGFDACVVRGSIESEKFSVFYCRNGAVIAAESVNAPGDHLSARKLIAQRARIPAQELADLSVTMKSLVDRTRPDDAA